MTVAVTGATGPFGRHAVETLLRRGVPADQIVAIGRRIEKIEDLGVRAERADYRNPEELRAAFEGAERILFVSGSEAGRRIVQHRNVIEAAKAVGADWSPTPASCGPTPATSSWPPSTGRPSG